MIGDRNNPGINVNLVLPLQFSIYELKAEILMKGTEENNLIENRVYPGISSN